MQCRKGIARNLYENNSCRFLKITETRKKFFEKKIFCGQHLRTKNFAYKNFKNKKYPRLLKQNRKTNKINAE